MASFQPGRNLHCRHAVREHKEQSLPPANMSLSFAAAGPDLESKVLTFLGGVFGFTGTPPNFSPAALAWKYFDPHPWYEGSRSLILRTPNGIVGHGCVVPVRFAANGKIIECAQIVDWAGGKELPGAGLMIYKRFLETSGAALLGIGGSEDTMKILPRLKWFRQIGEAGTYARPLRPWRQFARSPKKFRDAARFARNFLWKLMPPLPAAGEWRCRVAEVQDQVFMPAGDFVPIVRTREWFDYLLRCPLVRTQLVILENAGRPAGHAFLVNRAGSFLVADFVVSAEASPQVRVAAFSALTRWISTDPEAAEITAASSLPETCAAFRKCGLRRRLPTPVFLADPHQQFQDGAPLEITPLIGDWFYLYDPTRQFLC